MNSPIETPEPDAATYFRRAESDHVRRLWETQRLLRLLLSPRKNRARDVYAFLSSHNNLGDRTLYLNLGYWREAKTYDHACRALAELLGDAARLGPGQVVVDAGFGFGDQIRLWREHYGVGHIHGFNVSPEQTAIAKERLERMGVREVTLSARSALATGLPNASVDRVLALESAFHFDSREDFFREAQRILKPGGVLALADLALLQAPRGFSERVLARMGRALWQVPEVNVHSVAAYRSKLSHHGFTEIVTQSIAEDVFRPFKEYAKTHQADPQIVARVHPWLRAAWRARTTDRGHLDYLVVTAEKARRPVE